MSQQPGDVFQDYLVCVVTLALSLDILLESPTLLLSGPCQPFMGPATPRPHPELLVGPKHTRPSPALMPCAGRAYHLGCFLPTGELLYCLTGETSLTLSPHPRHISLGLKTPWLLRVLDHNSITCIVLFCLQVCLLSGVRFPSSRAGDGDSGPCDLRERALRRHT